jgi:site-specific DNA-methyltransferase (adenine-specific)
MLSKALFASTNTLWGTPRAFFDPQSARYGPFDLDVCATGINARCRDFISPEQDALRQPWHGVCWMNPPYSRDIGKWILKAWRETEMPGHAKRVVCLLPARTDTRWWHDYVQKYASRIEFVRGRLKFEGAVNSAPFPSAVAVFGNLDI